MTGKVWLTHPGLTPGHDFQCIPAAVGTWMSSGWVPREDQSDPAVADEPADPRPPAPAEPAPSEPVGEPVDESEPVKPVPSPRPLKES